MSYNGSGTFNINTAGQPVVTGTTITSTAFNLLTADLATGLSTALTKDGQTTPTANIPLGGFKITSLGAGTAATDAAQYGQLQAGATTIATVTGTDTYVGTLTPAIAAYATGNLFSFVAPNTNTGAATINLNSLGAKNITKLGSTALAAGDIVSGRVYQIEYDGTRFQLLNPSASTVASFSAGSTGFTPSSATTGAVTLAGTLATTNGGTGLTSFTANGVVYASSSSALATGSALVFDGTNLGIGTSSPSQKLEVAGNAKLTGTNLSIVPSTGTNTAYLLTSNTGGGFFFGIDTSTGASFTGTAYGRFLYSGGAYPMVFLTNDTERMRLDSSGNLGIGTSSPSAKLDVNGTIYSRTGGVYTDTITAYSGSSISVNAGSSYFAVTVNSSERMRLDSSGNLGLGVTPSVGNAGKCFEAGYAGNIFRGGTVNDANIDSNAYYNSGWKYANTGYATRYGCGNAAGQHLWFTAPSGTAGNAITFTQAMTLDASGNLLVGTTTSNGNNTNGFTVIGASGVTTASIGHITGSSSGAYFALFNYNGSAIGSITQSGTTAVLYNVTSDQRLKENIVDAPEFGSVIDSLKVRSFDWKTDQTHQRAGFIAQELVTVAPEAVHQPKDTDQMMAVDYSKLVPMLVKEIQSLRKRLADAGI
jgi:hypothetical protein